MLRLNAMQSPKNNSKPDQKSNFALMFFQNCDHHRIIHHCFLQVSPMVFSNKTIAVSPHEHQKSSQSNRLSFHPSWFMKRFHPPCRMIIPNFFKGQKTSISRRKNQVWWPRPPRRSPRMPWGLHARPVRDRSCSVFEFKKDPERWCESINYDTCHKYDNDKSEISWNIIKHHEISCIVMY